MADEFVLVKRGPLHAAAFSWQTSERRTVLTVICKVTYQLAAGQSFVTSEQVEVHRENVPWGGDKRHSLQAAGEFVPFKRGVDIVVTGHAYAPHGRPTKRMTVQMTMGSFRKGMSVYGDRQRSARGDIGEPSAFTKMPLCWERAFGGPGTSNPVGIAATSAWMPNFQPYEMTSTVSRIPPTGMGPIAHQWPDRLRRLGPYASTWDHEHWVSHPLPKDIDASYFNCAPLDQQVSQIDLADNIELENLLAESPHFTTRLPAGAPRAILYPHSIQHPLSLRCDTFWIDTDRRICCVTWRGSHLLESTYGIEILATMGTSREESATSAAQVVHVGAGVEHSTSHQYHSTVDADQGDLVSTTLLGRPIQPTGSALPFSPGTSELARGNPVPTTMSSPKDEEDPTATQMVSFVRHVRELPFKSSPSAQEMPSPMPVARISEPFAVPTLPRFVSIEPILRATPTAPEALIKPSVEPVKPPPMVPLPMVEVDEPSSPTTNVEAPAASFDPSRIPLETWAEITAEIDKAVETRNDVLKAHDVTEAEFKAIDKHWNEVLDDEATQLGFAQRFRFDAAYVGKLEQLRDREITAAEYMRIASAGGHARVADVLREMNMPIEAHLPIVRQWTAKLAQNRKLSAEFTQLMLSVRGGAEKPALEMSR